MARALLTSALVAAAFGTATAGLGTDYAPHTDEPLPEVDVEFARDEGEGFETVEDWRRAHERFWAEHDIHDGTLILAERFRLVEHT
jgi:hypothetical protein